MEWFHNLKTRNKIIILVFMACLFTVITGITGVYYAYKTSSAMEDAYKNNSLPVQWINEARSESRAIEALTTELFVSNIDRNREQTIMKEIQERSAAYDKLATLYEQTNLEQYEKERIAGIKEEMKLYRQERQRAVEMALVGERTEAYRYFTQSAALRLDKINGMMNELAVFNGKQMETASRQSAADAQKATVMIAAITAAGFIISLILGFVLANQIAKRLHSAVTTLQNIAGGDLTQSVTVTAEDEIGELGYAINETAQHLENMVAKIGEASQHMSAASQQLTASADQASEAVNHVAASMEEVTRGTEKQTIALDDTSATFEQMSAGIQQIAANAVVVAGTADKTVVAAQHGNEAIGRAIGEMTNIESAVGKTAEVISSLGERSKEIGAIVDTISGIAGQTNLLALNAAIEAARAGEQGRGFAVVADEVRKLAEQSQEAAKHIAVLIQEIQSETGTAVENMSDGTEKVKIGVEVVGNAEKSFREIVNLIGDVTREVNDISAAIQQMSSGSQQIMAAVREIDNVGKDNEGHLQSVAAAIEEQAASMEEIAGAGHSLSNLAEELNDSVQLFKV